MDKMQTLTNELGLGHPSNTFALLDSIALQVLPAIISRPAVAGAGHSPKQAVDEAYDYAVEVLQKRLQIQQIIGSPPAAPTTPNPAASKATVFDGGRF